METSAPPPPSWFPCRSQPLPKRKEIESMLILRSQRGASKRPNFENGPAVTRPTYLVPIPYDIRWWAELRRSTVTAPLVSRPGFGSALKTKGRDGAPGANPNAIYVPPAQRWAHRAGARNLRSAHFGAGSDVNPFMVWDRCHVSQKGRVISLPGHDPANVFFPESSHQCRCRPKELA
jgi:hypothetical protein